MQVKLINDFIQMLQYERGLALRSLAKYADDLDKFAIFVESRGKTFVSLNLRDCHDWLELRNQLDSAKTANGKLNLFKQFFEFLKREGVVTVNPFNAVVSAKVGVRDIGAVPSVATVLKLLDCISDIRDRAMFELMYASGLRISELCNLRTQSIHGKNRFVQLVGKGAVERVVPVNQYAWEYVMAYKEQYRHESVTERSKDFLFLSRAGSKKGSQMSNSAFYQTMVKYMDRAGIPRVYSPHSLRHAFATHLMNGGADILSVSKMLGHANVSTTSIYSHYAIDHLKILIERHHPLGKNYVRFVRQN